MTRKQLVEQIRLKKTFLCVGLDTDPAKIPLHLQGRPGAVLDFNKRIIDTTLDLCVSYKINTAFYEAMGITGWEAMEKTVQYIPPTHFTIADAKRGDIGNTSTMYAKAFLENLDFDAITIAPYMGEDSVKPFLAYEQKWGIILGLTSNPGSRDFEQLKLAGDAQGSDNGYLYETVLKKVSQWGNTENLMFVVGATKASDLTSIRKIIPDHFLLVPGVGFQGGSLEEVSKYGMNPDCGLLVNVSRAIIYAGEGENFTDEARAIAFQYQQEMAQYL